MHGHAQRLEQMQSDLTAKQETYTQDLESNMARCVSPSFAELFISALCG